MARRQIARGVEDAIGREADGERAEQLTEALAERLESLDVENELGDRPAEAIIAEICRELGLAKAQMTAYPPSRDATRRAKTDPAKTRKEAPHTGGIAAWAACPPQRPPDG
jgi:hypothetical protein